MGSALMETEIILEADKIVLICFSSGLLLESFPAFRGLKEKI